MICPRPWRKGILYEKIDRIFIIFALLLCGCGGKNTDAWQEQFDLGMQYLGAGEYAKAIDAFTAAIGIDPEREEAYTHRAETYIRLARQPRKPQLPDLQRLGGLSHRRTMLREYRPAVFPDG